MVLGKDLKRVQLCFKTSVLSRRPIGLGKIPQSSKILMKVCLGFCKLEQHKTWGLKMLTVISFLDMS
jgi:hypothetical protein